ncbi:hypothetical protein D3C87_431780 [compost metagenome]
MGAGPEHHGPPRRLGRGDGARQRRAQGHRAHDPDVAPRPARRLRRTDRGAADRGADRPRLRRRRHGARDAAGAQLRPLAGRVRGRTPGARRHPADRAAGDHDLRRPRRSLHHEGLCRPHRGGRDRRRHHGLQDRRRAVGQAGQGGLRAPADPDRRHPGRRRFQGHQRAGACRRTDLCPRRRTQEGGRGRGARLRPRSRRPGRRGARRPQEAGGPLR